MARLDHRIRRLEQKVRGRYSSFQEARLAQMSYEELMAVVVEGAVQCGTPEEQAHTDPDGTLDWLTEYLLKAEEARPEEKDELPARSEAHGGAHI